MDLIEWWEYLDCVLGLEKYSCFQIKIGHEEP